MKWPTDETLMAYADDMLEPEERARVAAFLENDPEAKAFVEALRRSGELAAAAFSDAMTEPPPQVLVDLILNGGDGKLSSRDGGADRQETPDASDAPGSSNVVPLHRPFRIRPPSVRQIAVPLAACLTILVGGIIGYSVGRGPVAPYGDLAFVLGEVPGNSALARLLESKPSGEAVRYQRDRMPARELIAVATFRDAAGRVCREFETTEVDGDQLPIAAGVACRASDGGWTVEGAVNLATAGPHSSASIEPASGVPEVSALEGLMQMLGATSAVAPDEEKQLLSRGWR